MEYEQIIKHWKDKKIATVVDLRESLSSYSIIFAYNSGAIENPEITYHNTREVFENGKVVNFTGNLRTVYEIANQKACFGAMLQHIVDRDPVTSELICEIHKYLTQGTYDERRWERGERPGTFKVHDYCVADGKYRSCAKRWRTSRIVARIYGKLQHICIVNLKIYMHLRMEMVAWDAR